MYKRYCSSQPCVVCQVAKFKQWQIGGIAKFSLFVCFCSLAKARWQSAMKLTSSVRNANAREC